MMERGQPLFVYVPRAPERFGNVAEKLKAGWSEHCAAK